MDDASPFTPAGRGRRQRPDAVWQAARRDYLAGFSGRQVCARYGLGRTTFRARAAEEGWRRLDQPAPDLPPEAPMDEGEALEAEVEGDLNRLDYSQLSFVANCRMMRAVLRGGAIEALRWARVEALMDAHQAEVDQWAEENEAISAAAREAASAEAPDSSDSSDTFFVNGVEVRL